MTATNGRKAPYTCPRCGHEDSSFHEICPGCGRPFFRDYIDTQVHPRDPDPQGIYRGTFWARVFLVLVLLAMALGLLSSFGIIRV